MKTRLLSLLIAATLAGGALASDKTPAPATPQQQAARAEIDRLVKRLEELSKQAGDDGDVRVIVRRGDRFGPEALEDEDGPGGDRQVIIKRVGPGEAPMAFPGHDFEQGPGLGVVLSPNQAAAGVRIAAVTPDSPAMKAGVRSGDVVLLIDGKAISGNGNAAVENARGMIGELKKGQVVKLRYARQGKTYDAVVRADDIRRVMVMNRDLMAPRARRPEREEFEGMLPPGVEMDIERLGPMHDCGKGKKDCGLPVIYEAFRWQGLNLASIDHGLGRYFGTEHGVLVLSSGEELRGLQSGDVIQRVGGVAVDSPRDVMRVLRDSDSGSQLKLDLMRDRHALPVTVTVPKSKPLAFITPPPPPPPPAPPTPPMAPRAPHAAPPAPPAPPVAPTPPPPPPRGGAAYAPTPEADEVEVVIAR